MFWDIPSLHMHLLDAMQHSLLSCAYTVGMTYSGSRWAYQQLGARIGPDPGQNASSHKTSQGAAVLTVKPTMSGFGLNVNKTEQKLN